jgi:hypothetical protein
VCVCVWGGGELQHPKRMGTLLSASGSRECEHPTPCVPRLLGLAHLAGLGRPLKGLPAPMRPLPMPQDVEQSHHALKLAPADRGVRRRPHSKRFQPLMGTASMCNYGPSSVGACRMRSRQLVLHVASSLTSAACTSPASRARAGVVQWPRLLVRCSSRAMLAAFSITREAHSTSVCMGTHV